MHVHVTLGALTCMHTVRSGQNVLARDAARGVHVHSTHGMECTCTHALNSARGGVGDLCPRPVLDRLRTVAGLLTGGWGPRV